MLGAPAGCACPGRMWLSRPWGTFILMCGPKVAQPAPKPPYMWPGAHMCPGALFAQAPYFPRRPVCTGAHMYTGWLGAPFAQAPHLHRRPICTGALFAQAPYLPRRLICPGAHMCPAALFAQAPICAHMCPHLSDRLVCRDYHLILCTR